MRTGTILGIVAAAVVALFAIYMIDVDQTEEVSLPDVDLSVEGGNMPEYDTEVGDIDVGTEDVVVEVPTIDIQSPEEDRVADSN